MTSPFRVARPQTEQEKLDDLLSWSALGLRILKHTVARDTRLCCGTNKYGQPRDAWGSYMIGGKRFCVAHKPEGAERR